MKLRTSLQLSAVYPIAFAVAIAISMGFKDEFTPADTLFVGLMGVLGLAMAAVILVYTKDILVKIRVLNQWVDAVLKGDLTSQIEIPATDDEVGRLSKALSKMLRELKVAYSQLQKESSQHQKEATQQKLRADASQKGSRRLTTAISKLQESQQEIVKKERMHVLEQVTRGVAHDFSDALTPILTTAELLLSCPDILDNREETIEHLKTVLESTNRAHKAVKNLAGLFHTGEPAANPVDLNDIVKQAITLTQPCWKEEAESRGTSIAMQTNLEIIPAVGGDGDDMRDMISNLIVNSVEAMPDGGTINISTDADGSLVTLEIRDTGKGMPDEVLGHCLEPFYSTKGRTGTGMGLTIAAATVKRHYGSFKVESKEDIGTRVIISLPGWIKPPKETDPAPAAPAKKRRLSVLVVDDEPKSLNTVAKILAVRGHKVDAAGSGEAAVEKIEPGKFDAAMIDRAMSGMSGDQLASIIKDISPDTYVIMLTGFGDIMLEEDETPNGVDMVMAKPPTITALDQALARVPGQGGRWPQPKKTGRQ